MESCWHLQEMHDGTTGHWKPENWKPTSNTEANHQSAKMVPLNPSISPKLSITLCPRHIKSIRWKKYRYTTEKLQTSSFALSWPHWQCSFPSDGKKEQNIQFCFILAFFNSYTSSSQVDSNDLEDAWGVLCTCHNCRQYESNGSSQL